MADTDAQLRDIRSELRRLQRQVTQLTQLTRTHLGDLMSLDEAALYTGYAKSYLYRLTGRGEIPCYRPTKRRVFVDRQELEKWVRGEKVKNLKSERQ